MEGSSDTEKMMNFAKQAKSLLKSAIVKEKGRLPAINGYQSKPNGFLDMERPMCREFARGTCKFRNCRFSHGDEDADRATEEWDRREQVSAITSAIVQRSARSSQARNGAEAAADEGSEEEKELEDDDEQMNHRVEVQDSPSPVASSPRKRKKVSESGAQSRPVQRSLQFEGEGKEVLEQ
jgi:hypothetical protein